MRQLPMTPKKKTNVVTKTAAGAEGVKTPPVTKQPAKAKTAGAAKTAASAKEQPRPADAQLKTWNQAVQLFSQRRFEEAVPLFRAAAEGPAVNVADKARSYEQICIRQCARPQVDFRTAEDHFYYGVERLNARDLKQAENHLAQALQLQPEGDHILYTMALCCGFAGDGNGAYENLKRAIDLEPKNRVMAKQDSEFTLLAQQFPALRALLTAEPAGDN
jgi:tetratricopeptide (TPR) repeat protein